LLQSVVLTLRGKGGFKALMPQWLRAGKQKTPSADLT